MNQSIITKKLSFVQDVKQESPQVKNRGRLGVPPQSCEAKTPFLFIDHADLHYKHTSILLVYYVCCANLHNHITIYYENIYKRLY
jgi:hypothetical protein